MILTSISRSHRHFEVFKFWPKKSLSAFYLLNQMTYSDQTSFIITLGWFKDLIRFWWPWHNFQGHHTLKFSNFDQKKLVWTLSLEPNDGFWPNFIVMLTSFSRSHQHFESQILTKKKLVWTLSLEPKDEFWPNFMYCIIGIIKRID